MPPKITNWKDIDKNVRRQRNIKAFFPTKLRSKRPEKKEEFYEIIESHSKISKKFGIKENITKFYLKMEKKNVEKSVAEDNFKKIIKKLIDDAYIQEIDGKIEKFSIEIYCEAIYDPVIIPARSKEQNSPEVIFNAYMKLQQSFKEVELLYEEISCIITTFTLPSKKLLK